MLVSYLQLKQSLDRCVEALPAGDAHMSPARRGAITADAKILPLRLNGIAQHVADSSAAREAALNA